MVKSMDSEATLPGVEFSFYCFTTYVCSSLHFPVFEMRIITVPTLIKLE